VRSHLLCDNFFSDWDGTDWGFVWPISRADGLRGFRETRGVEKNMTWRGRTAP
jgi:hypothetical protein